ncbi:nuclear transcription factor Y subunit B-6 isoform X1 [Primulina eburnea]|uniref:nuclear transcription factor Y subunit B-6 isoform X1 n=1 Tax=Primulina eburnea TaxID=1245227 RepID=UPI003C6C1EDE
MELGRNEGFHGYQKLPRTSSAMKSPEISMGQPSPQTNHPNTPEDTECTVREQDRFMPIANVIRIMRKILPPHAKISDDAKETIQECVSEYISFITSEANDRCQREQRKTITAEDVLWAMSKLGFDDYIEPLTLYLHRYREFDGGERGSLRGEPMVKRAPDHASFGFPGFPPAGFHVAHHHGFFGPPMMNGFLKDPGNVDPSLGAAMPLACVDPFTQCKEQL